MAPRNIIRFKDTEMLSFSNKSTLRGRELRGRKGGNVTHYEIIGVYGRVQVKNLTIFV